MTKFSRTAASAAVSAIGGNVTVHYIAVTPEQAHQWLANAEQAGFNNRTLKSGAVKKYAHEIANGNWKDTFDPIHLCVENKLVFPINGQHRLRAIIEADTAINLLVVSGVDRNAFKYYDQGQARDLAQIMAIASKESGGLKWKAPLDQATIARKLYRQDHLGGNPVATGTLDVQDGIVFDTIEAEYNGRIDDVFNNYGGLLTRISRGGKIDGNVVKGYGPRAAWGFFCVRAIETRNTPRLEELLNYFADPTGNRNANPIWRTLAAYIRAIEAKSEVGTGDTIKTRHIEFHAHIIAGLFVAWNAVANKDKWPNLTENPFQKGSDKPTNWFANICKLIDAQLVSNKWELAK
jgi:hypothetical protein